MFVSVTRSTITTMNGNTTTATVDNNDDGDVDHDENDDEYYADTTAPTAAEMPEAALPTRGVMMSSLKGSGHNHKHHGVSTRSFFDGLESVDDSSWDGGEFNNNMNNNADEMERRERGIVALYRRENKAVVILRFGLYLGLILIGVLLAVAITVMFSFTNDNMNSEQQEQEAAAALQAQFDMMSSNLYDSITLDLTRKLAIIDSAAMDIASYARQQQQQQANATTISSTSIWPNVTFPEFELHGIKMNNMADTLAVFILPLVSQAQKTAYEHYATSHYPEWINESLTYQQKATATSMTTTNTPASSGLSMVSGSISSLGSFPSKIQPVNAARTTIDTSSSSNDRYLPLWQMAPAVNNPGSSNTYNVDLLSFPSSSLLARSLNQLLVTRRAVLTPVLMEEELEQLMLPMKSSDSDSDNNTGPVSLMLYPLFGGETATNPTDLVGVYAAAFSWQSLLSKSDLSRGNSNIGGGGEGGEGGGPLLVAVLENDCNQTFTFRVGSNNKNATAAGYYQGPGNIHQDLDTIAVESSALYLTQNARFTSMAPGAVSLDQEFCQYKMQVYGTQELQQQQEYFYQQEPEDEFPSLLYAVIVSSVFCLTFICFVVYNWLVERRQKIVLEQAVQSTALVSTLFPEVVRDRLLKAQQQKQQQQQQQAGGESCHDIIFNSKDAAAIPMTAEASSSDDHDDDQGGNVGGGGGDPSGRGGGDDNNYLCPSPRATPKLRLKSFLRDAPNTSPTLLDSSKPIADFFPHCTVLFADISGFTAWSSQREPTQVFTLLQNLYGVFDKQAKKREVFKVETIGDSYIAVTGLPDPQPDHAIIMAKFAMECRSKMRDVTKKLVRTLGPETEDLQMRFGLNSGPVTAGVLGGTAARFQLFGDTVNTAARMESTGEKNRIHLSEYTASLLVQAGKEYMVTKRDGLISVKGKGNMTTYWLEGNISNTGTVDVPPTPYAVRRQSTSTYGSSMISFGTCDSSVRDINGSTMTLSNGGGGGDDCSRSTRLGSSARRGSRPALNDTKSLMWGNEELPAPSGHSMSANSPKLRRNTSSTTARLIDWNVDLLLRLLRQVEAKRQMRKVVAEPVSHEQEEVQALRDTFSKSGSVVDEVAEIIPMPSFEAQTANSHKINPNSIVLDEEVEMQLREFVTVIASMYRDNPFHNFEHACHVQMSMTKLLERVVNPDDVDYNAEKTTVASDVHNYTYGITSDPLTQFTVVFCALIHDVDHTGVSNGQLVKEKAHIATLYKNKSVAEQNSIDLAWDLLMQDDYENLRRCIYANADEFKRFRQLVVNTVLATDIFDKELSALRKNRWAKAFSEVPAEEPLADTANRKATIVIEHLIQGSDVSHTMQHWEIYKKWNERLFYEMYLSFKDGRTDTDPSAGWYKGELWFFDNYVIPLAKKLQSCGVFGVCSDECLNYAMENRRMWEVHGEEVVAAMLKTDYYEKLKMEKEDRRLARRRRLQYQKTADSGELNALAAAAEAAKKQEGGVGGGGDGGQQQQQMMAEPVWRTKPDQGCGGLVAPRRRPSTTTASADEAAATTGFVVPSKSIEKN